MKARTRTGSRNAMFFRMLMRATMVKPGRVISALVAVVVAASVTTAMMNLYVDVQAKLRKEFRSYGANVVVVADDGQSRHSGSLRVCRRPHRQRRTGGGRRNRHGARAQARLLVVGDGLAERRQF